MPHLLSFLLAFGVYDFESFIATWDPSVATIIPALVSHEPLGRWHSFTFGIEMCGVCVCVQKHTFFEGGVRVMALVSGPLIPAARRENEPRTP